MMLRHPKEYTVGRWNFMLAWGPDYAMRFPGWRTLTLGVFRLNQEPPEGCRIGKGDITGFMRELRVWLPWEVVR